MIDWDTLYWSFLLFTVSSFAIWKFKRSMSSSPLSRLPLPPGPPPLPIIGNLLDVPRNDIEKAFHDLNAKYGDLVYLNSCGQPMVVIGTHEVAVDLLERRSANYSDRWFSAMSELGGWTWQLSTIPYGSIWRRNRRAFHEYMNSNAIVQYRPIQELQTRRYLLRVLEDPKNFLHHGRHLFGAVIIQVGYGIDVDKADVDYLEIAEKAMETFSLAFLPGKYLVETLPILRHLPSCFPGAGFKREAAEWYPLVQRMLNVPWEAATAALRDGRSVPSMTSGLLDRISHLEGEAAAEEEEIAKNAVASAYTGGADTTLSTLQTFYVAMATYPEVQKRAQAELDAVIGPHRLPTMKDAKDLPYLNAVIKESLRWRPVIPLSIVHRSLEEDEYKGFRIPKGTSLVSSPWAYTRDPRHYPDPEMFNPERFLKDGKLNRNVLDPSTIIFGYGRRICPGRHFAEAAIFAAVSAILHTFSIAPPLDEHGRPVRLADTVKMSHGVIQYPDQFECIIKPRSQDAETLIRASCNEDEGV